MEEISMRELRKPETETLNNGSLYADELSSGQCMLLFDGCYPI